MTDTLQCRTCQREKPLKHFKKLGSAMVARSPTGRTHSHDCDACRLEQRAERKASRDAQASAEGEQTEAEANQEPDTRPQLCVGAALGFDVALDGTDFHISQVNGDVTAVIVLAAHELRALWEFAEGQAKRQMAEVAA